MNNENGKKKKSLLDRIRNRKSRQEVAATAQESEGSSGEIGQMKKEFEAVKKNPGHLTGWDFDRAFDFIERYPDSHEAEILIGQMYATSGQLLKGLSYESAVKVLDRMPGHAGADAIIRGMYKIESDYIRELRSDVIAYMLKVIPDHPLADDLTRALAVKNLTNAYDFVTSNPDNVYTRDVIRAMFDRDPNISVLLLQEKMDHSCVEAIFEGIYNITKSEDIEKLTPNAIIYILEVAPDHPKALAMIDVLVEDNYVKAYEFAKRHPGHALYEEMKQRVVKRKPELGQIFDLKK
ncbi:hypothetical protein [Desulforhopalus singaporensis]|uniref:HEAT repeat-containing protein n=1 Tax=Desulforhopalus singaporensis TaxID=91360 RepID=A0A1H0L9R9_9BACT|nr:hypothetical protein [Desulforhopalus singaporensis]SDO64938.1 hypothetical protein SAMN05660330_00716 [Desulforhopalus singaporensis]